MLNCIKVAVTGSLSSGKSTVCRMLHELGAFTIDSDAIVHRLLNPSTSLGKEVIQLLGSDSVAKGQFDRGIIAKKVFNHPKLLQALEAILHPAVKREIETHYKQCQQTDAPLYVVEVPLLFEAGWEKWFDTIVVVQAEQDERLKRYPDQEAFEKRAARQMDPMEKARRADYVIENSGNLSTLRKSVNQLFITLSNR